MTGKNGKKVAGLLEKDKKSFLCTEDEVYKSYEVVKNKFVANTTIGCGHHQCGLPQDPAL